MGDAFAAYIGGMLLVAFGLGVVVGVIGWAILAWVWEHVRIVLV